MRIPTCSGKIGRFKTGSLGTSWTFLVFTTTGVFLNLLAFLGGVSGEGSAGLGAALRFRGALIAAGGSGEESVKCASTGWITRCCSRLSDIPGSKIGGSAVGASVRRCG